MFRRAAATTAIAAALLLAASGCTGSPEPAETTPAALTEEEAFAAAEETYRAYVEALNQVDLSDPETFEAVYALTTGQANAGLRKEFSQMHADRWVLSGESTATVLTRTISDESVELATCLDVSAVSVVDSAGQSTVSPNRRPIQPMLITVDANDFLILSIENREGEPTCDG
jgi:hypothetical protein